MNLGYIDRFLRLKCASDLVRPKLFPDSKEITESFGAWQAIVRNYRDDYNPSDDKIKCIVVGDGCSPRTGALVAHLSRWEVWSVDPRLRDKWCNQDIDRLYVVPTKIEDAFITWESRATKIILLYVHSHAPFQQYISKVANTAHLEHLLIISIPCCVDNNLKLWDKYEIAPTKEYWDSGILSDKNLVRIWDLDYNLLQML